MPVTKSRTAFYDINLDQANTTGFLFGDDDNVAEGKLYTQANNEDNFPVLRREPNMVSQNCSSTTSTLLLPSLPLGYLDTGSCCFAFAKLRENVLRQSALVEPWLALIPALGRELAYFLPVWLTLNWPRLTSPHLHLPFISHFVFNNCLKHTNPSPRFAHISLLTHPHCTLHFLYCCCSQAQAGQSLAWKTQQCFVPISVCCKFWSFFSSRRLLLLAPLTRVLLPTARTRAPHPSF
jgi:hypothetical protein